jgi:hypothetical protein
MIDLQRNIYVRSSSVATLFTSVWLRMAQKSVFIIILRIHCHDSLQIGSLLSVLLDICKNFKFYVLSLYIDSVGPFTTVKMIKLVTGTHNTLNGPVTFKMEQLQ